MLGDDDQLLTESLREAHKIVQVVEQRSFRKFSTREVAVLVDEIAAGMRRAFVRGRERRDTSAR